MHSTGWVINVGSMNEAMNKVTEGDIKSLSIIDSWVAPLYNAYSI